MQETPVDSWVGKIPWRRDRILTPVFLDFPGGSDGKESACNVGDLGLIPGLGRTPGGRHGNPLQYSCLENPHGQRSLVGYSPWGNKELDMTDQLITAQHITDVCNCGLSSASNVLIMFSVLHLRRDFPGGPVAKILSSQCRAPRFDPLSGN